MLRISVVAPRNPDRLAVTALVWLFCAAEACFSGAPEVSLLPPMRPDRLMSTPSKPSGMLPRNLSSYAIVGSVCDEAAIRGVRMKRIGEDSRGCGISEPVRVTAVSGVQLTPAAVIDCETARALNEWVDETAIPGFRRNGHELTGMHVAASYTCRRRNNQPGAKMSEHSLGHAVDISSFSFRIAKPVTVLDGWNGSRGATLKQVHSDACGIFGTVLGPRSDAFHRNHFHFDTARYRSGSYCR